MNCFLRIIRYVFRGLIVRSVFCSGRLCVFLFQTVRLILCSACLLFFSAWPARYLLKIYSSSLPEPPEILIKINRDRRAEKAAVFFFPIWPYHRSLRIITADKRWRPKSLKNKNPNKLNKKPAEAGFFNDNWKVADRNK